MHIFWCKEKGWKTIKKTKKRNHVNQESKKKVCDFIGQNYNTHTSTSSVGEWASEKEKYCEEGSEIFINIFPWHLLRFNFLFIHASGFLANSRSGKTER